MLKKLLPALAIVTLLFSSPGGAASPAPQPVTLHSNAPPATISVNLADRDWRWLGEKRQLSVAIWRPTNPPFEVMSSQQGYSGINADYLTMIADSLGMKTRVLQYPSRSAALQGVIDGDVDMMVDDAGMTPPASPELTGSRDFQPNRPVLVGREGEMSWPAHTTRNITLAVARDYLPDARLTEQYPQARIRRYDNNQSAIAAVATGKADFMVADMISANFMIDRNYANTLAVVSLLPQEAAGARFIFRRDQPVLRRALDTTIGAIPPAVSQAMVSRWSRGAELLYLHAPLALTPQESRWLAQHSQLKVVINPFFAPLTVVNDRGEFHGISADILRLIHLRTGLNFTPVVVNSFDAMFDTLNHGEADFVAALSASPQWENVLNFTSSYVSTPFVLVVKNRDNAPTELRNGLTLITLSGSALSDEVRQRYPDIRWLTANNVSQALQQVVAGKADGAIASLSGAGYTIDRYFRGQLKIASRLEQTPARIGFAVRKDSPELESILNKALHDIPPSYITSVVNKWQGTPDIEQDTWELYDTPFYWLVALSTLLILSSLVWGISLRRTIRVRQQAQADLLAQLAFRDILLNGSPTPVYVVNPLGEIISRNRAFDSFFASQDAKTLALPLFDRRHPLSPLIDDLSAQMSATTLPEETESLQQVKTWTLTHGSEPKIIIHWATPWLDADRQLAGLICGWQDITEQQQLLQQVSQEKEKAEAANRAKTTFLATMSHEVRTPVSAIIGLLELVNSRHRQPVEEDDEIRLAHGAAQSLLGIIGDILDMAKIESGQLELVPEWVDVETLVAGTLQIFAGQAQQKGLRLSFHTAGNMSDSGHAGWADNTGNGEVARVVSVAEQVSHRDNPASGSEDVWLDAVRLRQVLANLIGNAVKFTQAGEISVTLISQLQADAALQLSVQISDSGPGMTAADQAKLFKPFSQLEAGRRQTGSGLGLVISKELVEKMGGELTMHSAPGQGTVFTLQLSVPSRPRVLSNTAATAASLRNGRPLNVLITDDHPTNRLLLRHQLETLGHRVTEAEDGIRALQLWQPQRFDLLITDCNMPYMDGYQLADAIRRFDAEATVWGLTANAQPEVRARCLDAGMDQCLFKPLTLAGLMQLLAGVVPVVPQPNAESTPRPEQTSSCSAQIGSDSLSESPALTNDVMSAAPPVSLDTLIDLTGLQQLTASQPSLLRQMLEKTREENQKDGDQARRCLQQQAWPQLASCLHRLSGAASILGAEQIEVLCDTLEQQCLQQPLTLTPLALDDLLQLLAQLDQAIRYQLADTTD
ncbi:transporter substrate-binding domain-containing protein [Erwinia sp. B116]|uniref:transporter substrate-binding domain-containing protein n=1 Tax=Erwinia sp. B116 TaxID=1561024 RepID=UPI000C794554|nr:transporter substrate-binding domain-containing protein [Erwinia sp. B116]PLV61041.1 hypothetical protein NV64_10625 [Erwinia sp. B116]